MESLGKRIAQGTLSVEEITEIMQFILSIYVRDFISRGKIKATANYLREITLEKIENRLEEALKQAPYLRPIWQSRYLVINGKRYKNLPEILKELRERPELFDLLNPQYLYLIHGDLSLYNIMTEGRKFLFVDPRGNDWGDLAYDLSKLADAIFGKYSLLEIGLYTLAIQEGRDIIVDFSFTKENRLWSIYEDLENKFQDIVTNSGISDYLSDSEPYWQMRTRLISALNFAGYVLFRLNEERKAKAFYIQSVILINEFLDKYVRLSKNPTYIGM
jgi:hypothetical protein